MRFRQDLARREQARVAFIQADNGSSYRRALLRRSRPSCQKFDARDWVLYWRRHKGGSRGERGRWYGPSQVICSDPKVVWLSHCGRLIRAAPEQLRSASMREWKAVAQQLGNSTTLGSVGQGVRGVVDLVGQGELPSRAEVDDQGDSPIDLPEATDVEPEAGEAVEINTGATPSGETTLAEQPEMEVSPVPSLGSSHAPENDGNSPPPKIASPNGFLCQSLKRRMMMIFCLGILRFSLHIQLRDRRGKSLCMRPLCQVTTCHLKAKLCTT